MDVTLRKVSDTLFIIIFENTSFVGSKKPIMKYDGAFVLQYRVLFVDARTKCNVDSAELIELPPTTTFVAHTRQIDFTEPCFKSSYLP